MEEVKMFKNPPVFIHLVYGAVITLLFIVVGLAFYVYKPGLGLLAAWILLGMLPLIALTIREFLLRPPNVQVLNDGVILLGRLGKAKKIPWNDIVWIYISSETRPSITGKEKKDDALMKIPNRQTPVPLTREIGISIRNSYQSAIGKYPPVPPPRTLNGQT
jgi:hypothetical protein